MTNSINTTDNLVQSIVELRETLKKSAQETDRKMRKSTEETKRLMRESRKEADRRMQETERLMRKSREETERETRKTTRAIKKLNDLFTTQWGKLVEAMVEGSLLELLKAQGIEVNNLMTRVYGQCGKIAREFDIIAVNGEELVAVEVKTTLKKNDVDYFLETMQNFKNFFPI